MQITAVHFIANNSHLTSLGSYEVGYETSARIFHSCFEIYIKANARGLRCLVIQKQTGTITKMNQFRSQCHNGFTLIFHVLTKVMERNGLLSIVLKDLKKLAFSI